MFIKTENDYGTMASYFPEDNPGIQYCVMFVKETGEVFSAVSYISPETRERIWEVINR